MIRPTINLNGTPAQELIDLRREAIAQIDALLATLRQLTPNGRDYPGDAQRCSEDRQTHYDRCRDLGALRDALTREAVAILNQTKGA